MAARQFDGTIFNNSIRKQRDSVMRFYFFLSAILIILHWKIAITSLIYSFHSTPNSRCFVYVHFQSHNAPNLPPLHISETGYYSMFHNPTAAVNLFHVGKQYLTLRKAEAAVTRNLIGRKIISNVKHADARNSLSILDVIRSSHMRHSASEYCK